LTREAGYITQAAKNMLQSTTVSSDISDISIKPHQSYTRDHT